MARKRRKTIHWRGQLVAAEHGVLSARALYARLKPWGLKISESQLTRIWSGQPKRINLDVLAIFCQAFDVRPDDLLELVERPRHLKAVNSGPKRAPSSAAEDMKNLIGPAVPPLPEGRWKS